MSKHRLIRTVAFVLALGAVAAPAAAARPIDGPADWKLPHDFQTADSADAVNARGTDVAAPDQQATIAGDDPALQPHDLQTAATRDAVVARGLYEPMRPEDQPQPPQDLRSPDTVDFANGRGTYNSPEVVVVDLPKPVSAPVSAGGIDWADAGLGAGSLLGITLIGLGGALFIVHRRGNRQVAV